MRAIFTNSKNIKTSALYRLTLLLSDKLDLKRSNI